MSSLSPLHKIALLGVLFVLMFFGYMAGRRDKEASRAEGQRLMETTKAEPVSNAQATPVQAEDRPATPVEAQRVLALRKEIIDLQQRCARSEQFYDQYMRQLDLLDAQRWGSALFERWQAGTLKDKELPKIVRAFSNSRRSLTDQLDEIVSSLTKLGFRWAALPDQDRVNWDLMTGQVRASDVERYEIVAESLRRSLRHTEAAAGGDNERYQVVAVLDRLVQEFPDNVLSKRQCLRCKKLCYFDRTANRAWLCMFCLYDTGAGP